MENNQVVVDFIANTSQFDEAVKKMGSNIQTTANTSTQAFEQFNQLNKDLQGGMNKTVAESQKLNDQFRDLTKTIAAEVLNEFAETAKKAASETVALRTQLINAKEALYRLEEAGKKGSQEWNDQINLTEKLATKYKELTKTVQALGTHTKTLSGLTDAVKGTIAAFEVLKGSTTLFGVTNEAAEKSIKELASAMALLQGITEIQHVLDEESAAMQLILRGQRMANAAAIQLETIAQSENIIVSKAATIAMAALNAVIEANPVMLLVGAIGAAVGALYYFTSAEEEAKDESKELNKELSKQRDELYKLQSEYQVAAGIVSEYQKKKNDIERKYRQEAIDAEKKLGGEATEVLKSIEEKKNFELSVLRMQYLEQLQEDEIKRLDKIQKMRNESHMKELKDEEEYIKQRLKLYDEADKKLREEMKSAGDNVELNKEQRIQYYFLAGMTKEEIAKRLGEIISDADEQAASVLTSKIKGANYDRKYFSDIWKEQRDKEKAEDMKEQKAISDFAINTAKQTTDAIFSIENAARQEQFNADMKRLEERKNKELENKNLTDAQKAAIEEKYARQQSALKKKEWQAEQNAKLEQAIINGALAVTNILATMPYTTFGVAQGLAIAGAIASTAAQIAVIESAKMPEFAKGTEFVSLGNNPKGTDTIPAYLNEGERVVPTEINRKLNGIPNSRLPELVEAALYPPMPHAPELSGLNAVVVKNDIDYKKLAKAFAEELKANPQTHFTIDRNGFSVHLIDKQNKVTKMNNRYES